ncbi:DNA recombination protein RmuC [candidate division WWE3 bacterium]|nr:DNA recombination protein RmuC [candidate division WWE3 bacterium]
MSTTSLIILISIVIVSALATLAYYLNQQIHSVKDSITQGETEKLIMEWMKELKKDMGDNISKSSDTMERQLKDQRDTMDKQTKMIWERLDNAAKVISGVQKHLGGMEELGKDMKDLNNILKSPKLRGNLGEKFLYEILENFLPQSLFKTQYKFRDGAICDAVIVTERGMIPVDSKFPMENFENMVKAESDELREKFQKEFIKDVKKRVDEIASKYILPEEGTTDQAIMYIPSESVYYDAIVRISGIEEYAQRKNVLITSPNTFTSFVSIVMIGYRQNELAENASEILKALSGIQIEAEKFEEDLGVLDGHITRTNKSMDTVKSKFGKLIGKITAVQALGEESGRGELPEPDSTIV